MVWYGAKQLGMKEKGSRQITLRKFLCVPKLEYPLRDGNNVLKVAAVDIPISEKPHATCEERGAHLQCG